MQRCFFCEKLSLPNGGIRRAVSEGQKKAKKTTKQNKNNNNKKVRKPSSTIQITPENLIKKICFIEACSCLVLECSFQFNDAWLSVNGILLGNKTVIL